MSYKSIIHGCCQVSQKPSNVSKELIVKYISDGNTPTLLYNYYVEEGEEEWWATANLLFDKVEIDGVKVSIADLDNAQGMQQLSEGEHTVKYTLKDPTIVGIEVDEQTGTPTKVGAVFSSCVNIESVEIPNSVTSIGDYAFDGCTGLTSISIPNSITSIGEEVFGGCSSLTSITIPDNMTSIGNAAFYGCIGLTSIICNATTAPVIQFDTFRNVKTNGTLIVPSDSSGYDVWMSQDNYYLGKYNWTKVEQ